MLRLGFGGAAFARCHLASVSPLVELRASLATSAKARGRAKAKRLNTKPKSQYSPNAVVTRKERQTKTLKAKPIQVQYLQNHVTAYAGTHSIDKLNTFKDISPEELAQVVEYSVLKAYRSIQFKIKHKKGRMMPPDEVRKEIVENGEEIDRQFEKNLDIKFVALARISRILNVHIPSNVLGSLKSIDTTLEYFMNEKERLQKLAAGANFVMPENVSMLPETGRRYKQTPKERPSSPPQQETVVTQ